MTDSLPTPHVLLDGPTVRRNIDRMAAYARENRLGLRPHTKTHKSTALAAMQLKAGAVGLTVAKPGEAQVMAGACDDLLMAYPAFERSRCELLAEIARSKNLHVAVDSLAGADTLADAARSAGSTIGILVDLDVGHHRTGVQSARESLALAQQITQTKGFQLGGLLFFPGHLSSSIANHETALAAINDYLTEILDLWRRHGLEAKIVSGGSSPTAYRSHFVTRQTEIRPGTYIFNDMNSVHAGCATLDQCAAKIVATVISTAVPDQIVLDAGSKTLTSDRCGPAPESGHGHILEFPEAKITKLSEEHAQVDIAACENRPSLGQRVSIIPNHICPCVNLQDNIWWQEPGQPPRSIAVEARGKVY